jgi:hypothetical protein
MRLLEIDPDHGAAVRFQDLRSELAEETESNHDECLTQCWLRLTDTLERDCPDGGVGRLRKFNALRNHSAEVLGNEHKFRMSRISGSCACNAIANANTRYTLPHSSNNTRSAVAQRHERVHLRLHAPIGLRNPVLAQVLNQLRNKLGLSSRSLQETFPATLDRRSLRTRANERGPHLNKNVSRFHLRRGDLFDAHATGSIVLR